MKKFLFLLCTLLTLAGPSVAQEVDFTWGGASWANYNSYIHADVLAIANALTIAQTQEGFQRQFWDTCYWQRGRMVQFGGTNINQNAFFNTLGHVGVLSVNEVGVDVGNLLGDPLRTGTWNNIYAPSGIYNEWLDIDAAISTEGLNLSLGSKGVAYGNTNGMTITDLINNSSPEEVLDTNGLNASWAVILIGTADMDLANESWGTQSTRDVFEANYLSFVQDLISKGTIPVLITIPPFHDLTDGGVWPAWSFDATQAVLWVNDIIEGIATSENLIWVDLHGAIDFYQDAPWNTGLMDGNGITLSAGDLSFSQSNITGKGADLLTLLTLQTAMLMKEHVGDVLNPETPVGPVTPPNDPSAPNAVADATLPLITVSWTDNSTDETGFTIERSLTSGSGFTARTTTAADVTSYQDSGLSAGTTYYYRIKSVINATSSGYTAEVSATTASSSLPTAPSNLVSNVLGTTSIELSWTDNSDDETVFQIDRRDTSGGTVTQTRTQNPVSGTGSTATYVWPGLTENTTYYFTVKAQNASGFSTDSNEVSGTTDAAVATIPDAPINLGAVAFNNSQIDLDWSDQSSDEDGFQIWQSATPGGLFTLIFSTAADATTYSVTGLTGGTSYTFKVLAFNTAGSSAFSNEATTSTSILPGSPIVQVDRDKGVTKGDRILTHISEFSAKRHTVLWEDGEEWIVPSYLDEATYKTTYSVMKTLPTLDVTHITPPDGLLTETVTTINGLRNAVSNGASNKIVYVSDGTYIAATPIQIVNSVNLFITGLNSNPDLAIVQGAGSTVVDRDSAIFTVTNSRNIGFEDLSFKESHAHGIRLEGSTNIYDVDILGCIFSNIYEASIKARADSDGTPDTIIGTSQNILIADNVFDNTGLSVQATWFNNGNHTSAIDIEAGQSVTIRDNTFTGFNGSTLGGGYGAVLVYNESDNITIIRNIITDSDAGITYGIPAADTHASTDYHVANGVISRNAIDIHSTSGAINLANAHYIDIEHNTLYQLSDLNPAVNFADLGVSSNLVVFKGNIVRGSITSIANTAILDVSVYNDLCVIPSWLDANLKLTANALGSSIINNPNVIFNMEIGYSANKLWTDYWPDYGAYDYGL